MKLRMRIRKGREVKFISHLDMMRALERAMRRARLPLKFTEGFNPRPKMSFTPAIPVGITSDAEYVDVEFTKELALEEIYDSLNSTLPPGIALLKVGDAEGKLPLSSVNRALYTVVVGMGGASREALEEAIGKILSSSEIKMVKKSKGKEKEVNIASGIYVIKISTAENDRFTLKMELAAGQDASVTPFMVIDALREHAPSLNVLCVNKDELFVFDRGRKILPL